MRRYGFSVEDYDVAYLEALARVKGFRSVGAMAKVAVEQFRARNGPTACQKERIDRIMEDGQKPSSAVLRKTHSVGVMEG